MSQRSNQWQCWIALLLAVVAVSACQNTKYLGENEELYTGAELHLNSPYNIPDKRDLNSEVRQVIRPEPNNSVLGLRPALWFYNIAGDTVKDQGIGNFIKHKLGEPPVLYGEVEPEFVVKLIDNRLYNNGFFNAKVDYEINRNKEKKVSLDYSARLQPPYRYDSIFYRLDTSEIGRSIRNIKSESLIKTGDLYDLKTLRDERNRIESALKNEGFYYFNKDYIQIQADTTSADSGVERGIDLFIGFQKNLPARARRKYRMNDIYVYPNYNLGDENTSKTKDTIHYKGYIFHQTDSVNKFRPEAIASKINFQKGKMYRREAHEYTLKRIMGMGAFKYANLKLNEVDSTGVGQLNASLYMTPMPKKTISAQLTLVSKSNNYAGPGLELSWRNRNLLGGAELLRISTSGGFETQIGGRRSSDSRANFSSYQFSTSMDLSIPRFLIPFADITGRQFTPQTRFGVSYELVDRIQYFRLNSTSFTSGYHWNETEEKEHDLNPLIVHYFSLSQVTDEFQQILDDNPFLAQSFAEQYILGPEYTYTYNNQSDEDLDNHTFFTGSADFSNPFSALGPSISTYYRFTSDFRYYFSLSESSKLVGRLAGGVGIPYSDSEALPYIKQFFTGGPNSIRAFRARTVGPGTVPPRDAEESFGFQDQNGNIKLEANLEYRFDIYSIFKGALFVDAGNIWLHEADPDQPGGVFESGDFLGELAAGGGVGLRLDISYFVIRLDLAWPFRKPYLPRGERWVNPLKDERPVLNVSIGYPF